MALRRAEPRRVRSALPPLALRYTYTVVPPRKKPKTRIANELPGSAAAPAPPRADCALRVTHEHRRPTARARTRTLRACVEAAVRLSQVVRRRLVASRGTSASNSPLASKQNACILTRATEWSASLRPPGQRAVPSRHLRLTLERAFRTQLASDASIEAALCLALGWWRLSWNGGLSWRRQG